MPADIILKTKKKMYWGNSKKDDCSLENVKNVTLYISIDLPYAINTCRLLDRVLYYLNNINKTHSNYYITQIKEVIVDMPAHIIFDILQEGMDIFTRMSIQLRNELNYNSQNTDVWFMFISSGCIKNKINDCTVVLLNQNPNKYECKYAINKKIIDIRKRIYYEGEDIDDYEKRLDESYFIIEETLYELFKSDVIIYENLYPIYKN